LFQFGVGNSRVSEDDQAVPASLQSSETQQGAMIHDHDQEYVGVSWKSGLYVPAPGELEQA